MAARLALVSYVELVQQNFLFVRSLRYVSASVYIGLGLFAALKAI